MTSKKLKDKKCSECPVMLSEFRNSIQTTCSLQCALNRVTRIRERKATASINKQRKAEKRLIMARKQALKTKSDYEKEAQRDCNGYIRQRDKADNCISCGRIPKKRNAGHFKSVGAYPELRFHPFNINLQCEHCNSWKSGNVGEYRINLIKKIGLSNVEWLEGPHEVQNRTVDDLIEIRQYYKEQVKLL